MGRRKEFEPYRYEAWKVYFQPGMDRFEQDCFEFLLWELSSTPVYSVIYQRLKNTRRPCFAAVYNWIALNSSFPYYQFALRSYAFNKRVPNVYSTTETGQTMLCITRPGFRSSAVLDVGGYIFGFENFPDMPAVVGNTRFCQNQLSSIYSRKVNQPVMLRELKIGR